MSKAKTLFFTSPGKLDIRESTLSPLKEDEVLVETICSAISAGTEMLVYRGQFPRIAEKDDDMSSDLRYPLAYGYACVGRIIETGQKVDKSLLHQLVFAFHPHASSFTIQAASLILLPNSISPEAACFLPNMETAVNLVHDGAPILGERLLILGQGIVGLLTASLLSEFPLGTLATTDFYEMRRAASMQIKGIQAFDPGRADFLRDMQAYAGGKFDLTYELSGSPSALNDAIAATTFSGRIVIGSWYGQKRAEIDLGGSFHRSRIKLIASQVSTISAELSTWLGERWNASDRISGSPIAFRSMKQTRLIDCWMRIHRMRSKSCLIIRHEVSLYLPRRLPYCQRTCHLDRCAASLLNCRVCFFKRRRENHFGKHR